jgi:hypothetical protein
MNALFGGSCKECDRKQKTIHILQFEVETRKLHEARRLAAHNSNVEAATTYRHLKALRDAEKERADAHGDPVWAADVESASLLIQQELAAVLAREGIFNEAEDLFRNVWKRRRELTPNDLPAIRTPRFDLCLVLSSQQNPIKNREAENLHRAEWQLHEDVAPGGGLGQDHSWIIKNGYYLAMLLNRKGSQDDAVAVLRKVLGYCMDQSKETNEIIGCLVAYLLDSAQRDEALGHPFDALPKLNEVTRILTQRFLQPNSQTGPWDLESVIAIARMIDQKKAHSTAEPLWCKIQEQAIGIHGALSPQAFDIGLALASSLRIQGRAQEAKPLVESLLRAKEAQFEQDGTVRMLRCFLGQPVAEGERGGQPMDRTRGNSSRSHRSGGHTMSRGPSGQGGPPASGAGSSPPAEQISPRLRVALRYIGGAGPR